jgi:uncharacterized membrane protein YhaH (DUF805 family)
MQQYDLMTFYYVFHEMLGPWLWIMLGTAIIGIVGFILLVVREGKIQNRRLIRSELLGLIGGVVALVIMAKVSSSGFTDAGGPADWFLIALVYGIGAVGSTILIYTLTGWLGLWRDNPYMGYAH